MLILITKGGTQSDEPPGASVRIEFAGGIDHATQQIAALGRSGRSELEPLTGDRRSVCRRPPPGVAPPESNIRSRDSPPEHGGGRSGTP